MSILHAPSLFVIPLFAGEHKNRENLKQEAIVEVLSKQKKHSIQGRGSLFRLSVQRTMIKRLKCLSPCSKKRRETSEITMHGKEIRT